MSNIYHIIHEVPALEEEDMYVQLEFLARELVNSGLLRIDANLKCNFVRFSEPRFGINMMFSYRQLHDEKLLPRTKSLLKEALYSKHGVNHTTSIVNQLKKDLDKKIPVDHNLELKLARIIVQLAHPILILLVLLEKVEVFISYSYNIEDLLDVITWQTAGQNSGMQSTNGRDVAIFVSCGGNPTKIDQKWKPDKKAPPQNEPTYGDGYPALARAMVIGGQEFGHYADIIRNQYGQLISRHSADFGGTRAKEDVRLGRLADLDRVNEIYGNLQNIGLNLVFEDDKFVKFFRKNRIKNLYSKYRLIKLLITKRIFVARSYRINFLPIEKFKKEKYTALTIVDMIKDMAFNLAPKADVYKNDNKQIEEAIACIEALARVPQQVNKWGHQTTRFMWPNLYNIYYNEVIPGRIHDFENLTGQKFTLYPETFSKFPWYSRIIPKSKKFIKKYYHNIFKRKKKIV
jgi:hypothetical protein